MEKLYYLTKKVELCFASKGKTKTAIEKDAKAAIEELQQQCADEGDSIEKEFVYDIIELTTYKQLDERDVGSASKAEEEESNGVWGTEEYITPHQFLARQNDPEYQDYLQLKNKFEKEEKIEEVENNLCVPCQEGVCSDCNGYCHYVGGRVKGACYCSCQICPDCNVEHPCDC